MRYLISMVLSTSVLLLTTPKTNKVKRVSRKELSSYTCNLVSYRALQAPYDYTHRPIMICKKKKVPRKAKR